MNYKIRAEVERALHDRRPGVIADADCASRVRRLCNEGNVGNLELRIRGRLYPKKFCLRPHRLLDLIKPRHVDEAYLEAPPDEDITEQLRHSMVNIGRRDDVIARRQGLQDRARSGQTGAKGRRVITAFQRRQTLLERVAGRIRTARVNVTVRVTAFGITLEGGGKMNGRGDRHRRWINGVPGVHRQCLDPHFAIILHRALVYVSRRTKSRHEVDRALRRARPN